MLFKIGLRLKFNNLCNLKCKRCSATECTCIAKTSRALVDPTDPRGHWGCVPRSNFYFAFSCTLHPRLRSWHPRPPPPLPIPPVAIFCILAQGVYIDFMFLVHPCPAAGSTTENWQMNFLGKFGKYRASAHKKCWIDYCKHQNLFAFLRILFSN